MKKRLFFVVLLIAVIFPSLTFGQGMPTLYGKENLTSAVVAVSDTASVAGHKSLKFTIKTDQGSTVSRRFARWNLVLSSPQNFSANAIIYANVMVPATGDVNIALSLLKDTTVLLNSNIYTVSQGSWHRQGFQFPAVDISGVNGIRISASFPQGSGAGTKDIFTDALIYSYNGSEIIWNDCSGSGGSTIPVITNPVNNTSVSSPVSVTWTGAGSVQLQLLNMSGTAIKDTVVTSSPCVFTVATGQYQLRGRFQNATQWTSTIVFTVSNIPVGVPVITNPIANANYQNPISITWSGTGNTEWQVMNMSGTVLQNPTSTALSLQLQALPDGQYQLRGRFQNATQWTATVIFNVMTVTAQVPSIINPISGSTGNPLQTIVRYSGNTPEYEIMVAKDYAFTESVNVYTTTNQTSFALTNLLPSTTYYLKMRGKISSGYTAYSAIIDFMTIGTTGVENDKNIPTQFSLSQNYPNPFNPATSIKFSLPKEEMVQFRVFDVLGREINALSFSEHYSSGVHSIILDCSNISSGVYIYTITAGKYCVSKKMNLVK